MEGVAVSVSGLRKLFGSITALDDITFNIMRGEVFGYLGPNGAGKTTTIRILLGLIEATLGNYAFYDSCGRRLSRERIGFVLEKDGLFNKLTAYQNMFLFGRIYRVPQLSKRIHFYFHKMKLMEFAHRKVGTLSRGTKKKLAIIRAMIHDPEVLILDEPTAGLDPTGQKIIQDSILELSEENKITVFLSSHNLEEVQIVCSSVAIINNGKIVVQRNMRDIAHNEKTIRNLYLAYVER